MSRARETDAAVISRFFGTASEEAIQTAYSFITEIVQRRTGTLPARKVRADKGVKRQVAGINGELPK